MPNLSPDQIGRLGEDLALGFLTCCGYRCLARRVRAGRGEIDLVMARPGRWIFVEVKARGPGSWGPSAAAVTRGKLWRLRSAVRAWLATHPPPAGTDLRCDVVAVDVSGEGQGLVLHHYRQVC